MPHASTGQRLISPQLADVAHLSPATSEHHP
jgi:hypothetical protein